MYNQGVNCDDDKSSRIMLRFAVLLPDLFTEHSHRLSDEKWKNQEKNRSKFVFLSYLYIYYNLKKKKNPEKIYLKDV